jgi:phage protein D
MRKPIYSILLNGKELAGALSPYLSALSLSESREDEADTVHIVLDDSKGKLALPARGGVLSVAIGWADTGLVDKGTFTITEVEHSGAPDVLTIQARSASMTKEMVERIEKSWHATTLGAIVKSLAAKHGLKPAVTPSLDSIAIPHIDQTHESDMGFLTRLSKRYDATMTVKDGNLLFKAIGDGKTASGKALPTAEITRADGDSHHYHVSERENYVSVRAQYRGTGKKKHLSVIVGGDGTHSVKVLPEIYPTKEEATAAAQAELNRTQRSQATLEYTLALARPDLMPESPVYVSGFNKPDIDDMQWVARKVHHEMGDAGFTTKIDLEQSEDPVTNRHRERFAKA